LIDCSPEFGVNFLGGILPGSLFSVWHFVRIPVLVTVVFRDGRQPEAQNCFHIRDPFLRHIVYGLPYTHRKVGGNFHDAKTTTCYRMRKRG